MSKNLGTVFLIRKIKSNEIIKKKKKKQQLGMYCAHLKLAELQMVLGGNTNYRKGGTI